MPRHCNKALAANDGTNTCHCEEAKPTWQSRWFKKMHPGLAGLLHFVRNDGKGVVNYGSINSQLATQSLLTTY